MGSNPTTSSRWLSERVVDICLSEMEKYIRKPNCICKICNKEIYRRPSQINKGNVYCSQDCFGKSCEILIACVICGIEYQKGLHKKTCSRVCANKLRIGTKYTGRPLKDKVKTAQALKTRLIELRGPKCERCPYSNVKILNVHHKIRRADGGSDDLDNLELICPNCHAEEHYGS